MTDIESIRTVVTDYLRERYPDYSKNTSSDLRNVWRQGGYNPHHPELVEYYRVAGALYTIALVRDYVYRGKTDAGYPADYYWAFVERNVRIFRKLLSLAANRSFVLLDFGSGIAIHSLVLTALFSEIREILCVEVNRESNCLAANIADRLGILGRCEFFHNLSEVGRHHVDVIMAMDVMEHVNDPLSTMNQLVSLARPGNISYYIDNSDWASGKGFWGSDDSFEHAKLVDVETQQFEVLLSSFQMIPFRFKRPRLFQINSSGRS